MILPLTSANPWLDVWRGMCRPRLPSCTSRLRRPAHLWLWSWVWTAEWLPILLASRGNVKTQHKTVAAAQFCRRMVLSLRDHAMASPVFASRQHSIVGMAAPALQSDWGYGGYSNYEQWGRHMPPPRLQAGYRPPQWQLPRAPPTRQPPRGPPPPTAPAAAVTSTGPLGAMTSNRGQSAPQAHNTPAVLKAWPTIGSLISTLQPGCSSEL